MEALMLRITPQGRWIATAVAVCASLAVALAIAAPSRAGTTGPIDEGIPNPCPVFSSTDPDCTNPPPIGGGGIPCLDPTLACPIGGGGIGGGGGGGGAVPAPTLSVRDTPVTEPDSGTTAAVFTVSLSSTSTKTVTVDYTTADGTARTGADYEARSGRLTFAPGQTSLTVSVPVIGETDDERAEHFLLQLLPSNLTNASIGDGEGRGSITDNDLWVKVWTNAFIPGDIPGVTEIVPGGPHAGQTMIDTPDGAPLDLCVLTDQRGFSADPAAPHRMQSLIVVDPKQQRIVEQRHHSDETIDVICDTGTVTCSKQQTPSGSAVSVPVGLSGVAVALGAEGSNPCTIGAPDINYEGTLRIERGNGSVSVNYEGLVEKFPDLEMYAAGFHENSGRTLFQKPHTGGLSDLIGDTPRVPVSGSTVVTSSD
jgi:Calx-beta domain